jgi:hypothetical protein
VTELPVNLRGDIPEFHRLTGEVIRSWADIENSLWHFVSAILGVDQFRARIIMGSIVGARARRDFIARLAETYLDPALLPKCRGLLRRVKTLGQSRNVLAHTSMHINVDGAENMIMGDVFTGQMNGGLDFEFRSFPLNDLRVLAGAMEQLRAELIHFLIECDGHVLQAARIHREPGGK